MVEDSSTCDELIMHTWGALSGCICSEVNFETDMQKKDDVFPPNVLDWKIESTTLEGFEQLADLSW